MGILSISGIKCNNIAVDFLFEIWYNIGVEIIYARFI